MTDAETALDAIEQEALRELERRELPATALGPYAGQRAQSCEPGGHRSARDKVCRCCYGRGGGCSCGDKCKPCDGTGVVYE